MAQIYRNQQGTGRATTLGQQDMSGLEFYLKTKMGMGEAAAKSATEAATAKAKKVSESLTKMGDINFDGWYRHEEEMQPLVDGLYQAGIDLINKGIDPWTATTPESTQFRKDANYLKRLGEYSKQLKEDWKNDQVNINDKDNKFNISDKMSFVEYYEQKLSKHVAGLEKPFLRVNNPEMHLAGLAKSFLEGVQKGEGDVATNRNAIIEGWLITPGATAAAKTELINLAQNDQAKYQELQSEAVNSGKDIVDLYMTKYIDAYIIEPNFNIATKVDEMINVEATKKASTNAEGGSSSSVTYDRKSFPATAKRILSGDARLRSEFVKNFGGTSYTPEIEKKAIDYIVGQMNDKYKDEKESKANPIKEDKGGMSDSEFDANFNTWHRDFLAGKKEAASFVEGSKTVDNTGVEATAVSIDSRWKGIEAQIRILRANRSGHLTSSDLERLAKLEATLRGQFLFTNGTTKDGFVKVPKLEDIEIFYETDSKGHKVFNMTRYVDAMQRQNTKNIVRGGTIDSEQARNIYEAAVRANKHAYKSGSMTPTPTKTSSGTVGKRPPKPTGK